MNRYFFPVLKDGKLLSIYLTEAGVMSHQGEGEVTKADIDSTWAICNPATKQVVVSSISGRIDTPNVTMFEVPRYVDENFVHNIEVFADYFKQPSVMALRGIKNPCTVCEGLGIRVYGRTTLYNNVCDKCWGSGDAIPWSEVC